MWHTRFSRFYALLGVGICRATRTAQSLVFTELPMLVVVCDLYFSSMSACNAHCHPHLSLLRCLRLPPTLYFNAHLTLATRRVCLRLPPTTWY